MNASTSELSRGVCPAGFHVPSDCEWKYLEHGQGMSIIEQNKSDTSWGGASRSNSSDKQGTPGYKLRSAGGFWTNASGFKAFLFGMRDNWGEHTGGADYASFYTSSARKVLAPISRRIWSFDRGIHRVEDFTERACSVRCLKD